MTFPTKVFGSLAFVSLVAGIWWALSEKDLQEGRVPSPAEAVSPSALPTPKPPVEEAVKREATAVSDNVRQDAKEEGRKSPESEYFENRAQKMTALPNPDPALASEMEYQINTSLAANLDLVRFIVTSVICRGHTCQILATDLNPPVSNGRPPDMTKGWGLGLGKALTQLMKDGVRNPRTGEQIKDFRVDNLGIGGGEIITLLTFKEPDSVQ